MRILHVLEPADGGVATYVRELVAEQVRRGHRVSAVVSDRGTLAADLRARGAGVVALNLPPELWAPGPDVRAVRVLARLLLRGDWDVVHTHEAKAGALARPLAAALGYPVVHAPHTYPYMTQADRGRGPGRRLLTLSIERALAVAADAIVVPSAFIRDTAVRDRALPPGRVALVPNGYDPPSSVPPDPDLVAMPGQAPLIGFLSRMTFEKNPLTLVDALARLSVPFRAALVGDGPLAGDVAARVAALGLEDRVSVRRYPAAGGAAVLSALDVYVLPSIHESFGIGLLEAMRAGLPVVASRAGAIPEVVAEGTTALLVPPGDAAALAGALERLLVDPALRRRLGDAGRAHAARFSVRALADALDAVYARAAARPRRRLRRWARAAS